MGDDHHRSVGPSVPRFGEPYGHHRRLVAFGALPYIGAVSRPASERPGFARVVSHVAVMVVVAAILGVVVSGLAIPFAGLAGLSARSAADSIDDLPTELETDALPQKTTIEDVNGDTIATVFDQNRVNVPLSQVSRTMVEALLAIEDYRFYEHGALDVKGTLRAFVTNQASGGVTQGGSSITQQLVKQTLLAQADGDEEAEAAATADTYARKLKELRYAIALEKRHSKDWILERYLNIAYFGDGAYGVQAAARHYFNVNASKLNLKQSAMLAGIVKSPAAYDPTNNPDRSKERRNLVINKMAQLSVISQKRADKVSKRGLGVNPRPQANGCVSSRAPWFCEYTMAYLKQDPSLGDTPDEREQLIKSGGLTIHTTLDLRFQEAADDSVSSHVYAQNTAIGALAMIEPGTGQVRAIAQSRPVGRGEGETFLNYVVPKKYGNANGFQPGSTFKAFVLAAALEQGIPANTTINAPQQVFLPNSSFRTCDGNYQSSDVWSPQNSTGTGNFTLYTGTQQSVNTFFAQLEQRTGLCQPYRLAKSMGIQLSDPSTQMVPSFTLGVADVSPLEMAEAYSTFAARGLHCDAYPVTSIDDSDGETAKEYSPTCSQVMPSAVADTVNDILRGVQEGGGFGAGAGIALTDRDDAGKTGTTSESKAVWFNGYTPNLATAAVVAGADQFGNQIGLDGVTVGPSTVYSAAGSTTAGPIWGDAMKAATQYLDPESFTPPSGTDIAGLLVDVPDVSGMSLDEAISTVEGVGLQAQLGDYRNSELPQGTVIGSSPDGDGQLSSGDTVTLYQSNGTPPKKGRG